jgi:S1 RNA binding domain protein
MYNDEASQYFTEKGRPDGLALVSPIEVGSVVEGTVTGITRFGAFVLLANGKTGLVHISEVADAFVQDINEFLKEQQTVRVKVVACDERGKIALSIKQADPAYRPVSARPRDRRSVGSFEDKLSKFMKDSEERLGDLRRVESKRGGRGGRSFGD